MYRKLIRRMVSVFLCLIVLISTIIPAVAEETEKEHSKGVYSTSRTPLSDLYMYSVYDLQKNYNHSSSWLSSYNSNPFPGLFTLLYLDTMYTGFHSLATELDTPELHEQLQEFKLNPILLLHAIPKGIIGGIEGSIEGALPGIEYIIYNTYYYMGPHAMRQIKNQFSYSMLQLQIDKNNNVSLPQQINDFFIAIDNPNGNAITPGDYAKSNFPQHRVTPTINQLLNRYSSTRSAPQYEDPSITYQEELTFSPEEIQYNSDGTMSITLKIYNQSKKDIVLNGFQYMNITDQNGEVFFESEDIKLSEPAYILYYELGTNPDGNIDYGGRNIDIIAEPGTFKTDQDLRNSVGLVTAAPDYENVTFLNKTGDEITNTVDHIEDIDDEVTS